MMSLDPTLLLLLIAGLFILVFGGLSFIRREGLSAQFALEGVALTALVVGGARLLNVALNPFLFLVILYAVTMRSRLTVDVANLLARRGSYEGAYRLYRLSLAWWPDASSRLIVQTNLGAAQLYEGQLEAAIRTLEGVLEVEKRPRLGLKYEAACRYNLGLAYEQKGESAKAIVEFNEVLDVLPGSAYAKAAQAAIKRRKKKRGD
jgi:tetratricopeptide (TPR) repeat protein